MKKICVCIAYKYNDAYYSFNIDEYKLADYRILIDFAESKCNITSMFDETIALKYDKRILKILSLIGELKLYFKGFKNCNIVIISSNYHLMISRLISGVVLPNSSLVMIEDGLMSYLYNSITMPYGIMSKVPSYMLYLMRATEDQLINRLVCSYYLFPQMAKTCFPKKRISPIRIYDLCLKRYGEYINGKKVFIGQPLYMQKNININIIEYQKIIIKLYKDGLIDIYIDHHGEDQALDLDSVPRTSLQESGYTLEMIISEISELSIVTFYSSLAYTSHLFNRRVKVICIKHPSIEVDDIIYETMLSLNQDIEFINISRVL